MKSEILSPYIQVIRDYLAAKIDGQTFLLRYLKMFKQETNDFDERTFQILDKLFADIDRFEPDSKLLSELRRDAPSGSYLDEAELRDLVITARNELESENPT
jgi:hypothetical protein